MLKFGRSLTLYSQAPPRFAKRPKRRVPHSQPTRYRQRCNADRSGFVPIAPSGPSSHDPCRCPHIQKEGCGIDEQTSTEGHAAETKAVPAGANISRKGGDSEESRRFSTKTTTASALSSLRFGHAELIGAALTAVPPKPLVCLR